MAQKGKVEPKLKKISVLISFKVRIDADNQSEEAIVDSLSIKSSIPGIKVFDIEPLNTES